MNLPRVKLTVADHDIHAYVARTQEERSLGLMHRRTLAEDEGMLFVCDEVAIQRFWMKDTPLALSIAFIDDDGTILKLEDMEPNTLEGCCSDHKVRYVLEVSQGWFAGHGIEAGAQIEGPVFLVARAEREAA